MAAPLAPRTANTSNSWHALRPFMIIPSTVRANSDLTPRAESCPEAGWPKSGPATHKCMNFGGIFHSLCNGTCHKEQVWSFGPTRASLFRVVLERGHDAVNHR